MASPLDPTLIRIDGVLFVGTNVEMRYRVLLDASPAQVEAALEALLREKLGLYALTPLNGGDEHEHCFSVLASPLDRLFHKIGPNSTLTLVKHYSQALNTSDANLRRLIDGLAAQGVLTPESALDPWHAGSVLAFLQRHAALLAAHPHPVTVMGRPLPPDGDRLPIEDLATLPERLEANGGKLELCLPEGVWSALF